MYVYYDLYIYISYYTILYVIYIIYIYYIMVMDDSTMLNKMAFLRSQVTCF
jgi:hypothetical protein